MRTLENEEDHPENEDQNTSGFIYSCQRIPRALYTRVGASDEEDHSGNERMRTTLGTRMREFLGFYVLAQSRFAHVAGDNVATNTVDPHMDGDGCGGQTAVVIFTS